MALADAGAAAQGALRQMIQQRLLEQQAADEARAAAERSGREERRLGLEEARFDYGLDRDRRQDEVAAANQAFTQGNVLAEQVPEGTYFPPEDPTAKKLPGYLRTITTPMGQDFTGPMATGETPQQAQVGGGTIKQATQAQQVARQTAERQRGQDKRAQAQLEETIRSNKATEGISRASQAEPKYVEVTVQENGQWVTKRVPESETRGKSFPVAPSAAERMDTRKFSKARPVMRGVGELSERINTLQGVVATASGAAERQKAKINLNDDIAEYEALVSGFTPLVARALGHTGVLTQQDVDSVKALFPKPGDSKSLRDRKVKRLEDIFSELEGAEGGGGEPERQGGGPQPGEKGTINGQPVVWDGQGWLPEGAP